MASEPRRRIDLDTAPNLRDVGGWPTSDGRRVRTGLVFRCAGLDKLAGPDLDAFAGLGVRTVFDLRTTAEVERQPDVLPAGTDLVHLDVLADSSQSAPAELHRLGTEPELAAELLGGGQAEAMFVTAYRDLVRLPSALSAYATLLRELAEIQIRPAAYHCTAGKDRTGWATAVLLTLLGVSEDAVMEDYLRTNDQLLPALQPILDLFEQHGGDSSLLRPVVGVQASYLEAAYDEVRERFGSFENYLTRGLGLSETTLVALRDGLLED